MLAVHDLHVTYPGAQRPALAGVELSLASGELVAIVGPNGSGKSTLAMAAMGLVPATRGTITLDGRAIADWPRRALAMRVGMLPQRESIAFPLSVREAVTLGRYARLGPLAALTREDRDAVEAAMHRTDVAALATRGIDTLSGGEWQRVRLARALASRPMLLLLDEPSASLDIAHEMALFTFLRELAQGGLGVLVITHHLNLAARLADRMVLLHDGRITAAGRPDEVLTSRAVGEAFTWPVAITTWCDGSPQVVPLLPSEVIDADSPPPTGNT
jgi:iron complex transport system ATP-binding protein